MFLADVIDATEAERIGLVNRVVPADDLDRTVDELVARLARCRRCSSSLTKRLLNQAFSVTMAEALESEDVAQVLNFSTSDVAGSDARVRREARPALHRRVDGGRASSSRPAQPAGALRSTRRARARAPRRPPPTARARRGSRAGRGSPARRAGREHGGGVADRRRAEVELRRGPRRAERDQHVGRLEQTGAPSAISALEPAADGLRREPGYGEHRAAVLERVLGGDARAALAAWPRPRRRRRRARR